MGPDLLYVRSILFSVPIRIVRPCSVVGLINLCAVFCKISSVTAVITWSSENNSVDKCSSFDICTPVLDFYFCRVFIISSVCILNCEGEREGKFFAFHY
jgi:hypothetical protein